MNIAPCRPPVECVIEVDEKEITDFYPYLREVRVEMVRGSATVASIVLDSIRIESGEWTAQDSGVFVPWRRLKIYAHFGNYTREVMRGFIKEVRSDYPEAMHEARMTIIGQDETLQLDRVQVREVLSTEDDPLTDGDIARAVASQAGMRADIEEGLTNSTLGNVATPVRLLQDRAEVNGYEFYVREGVLHFRPPRLDGDAQPTIMVYAGNATNCLDFSVAFDGHAPDSVRVIRAGEGTEVEDTNVQPDLPLLGATPATSDNMGLDPFIWIVEQPTGATDEEVVARARSAANENAWKIVAEGELDGALYGHVLMTCETVAVDGVGDANGGRYYVDEVHHAFSTEGYRQRFKLLRNATGDDTAG